MKLSKDFFDQVELTLENKDEKDEPFFYDEFCFVEVTREDFEKAKKLMLKHNPKRLNYSLDELKKFYESNYWISFYGLVLNHCRRRKTYKTVERVEKEVRTELGIDDFAGDSEKILRHLESITNYQNNIAYFKKEIGQYRDEIKVLIKNGRAK